MKHETDPSFYERAKTELTQPVISDDQYREILEERFERTLYTLHSEQRSVDRRGPYHLPTDEVSSMGKTITFLIDENALHAKTRMVVRMRYHLDKEGYSQSADLIQRKVLGKEGQR